MEPKHIPQEIMIHIIDYFSDEEFMKSIQLLFRSPRIDKRRDKINASRMRQSLTKHILEIDDILYDTYYISTPNMLKDAICHVVDSIFNGKVQKRLIYSNHPKHISYKQIAKMELFRPFSYTNARPVEILENKNLCPVYRTTKFQRRFLIRKYKTVAALIY